MNTKTLSTLFAYIVLSVLAFAGSFRNEAAGTIRGARLGFLSETAITIGVGYGEVSGKYWEIRADDPLVSTGYNISDLTSSSNGMIQYLYIDGVNSPLPDVVIRNSSMAPSWSNTLMGWYNGVDRCIGAVWINANGTIMSFSCSDDTTYLVNINLLLQTTPATANIWSPFDFSNYSPKNSTALKIAGATWRSGGSNWIDCTIAVWADTPGAQPVWGHGSNRANVEDWFEFTRGARRSGQYSGYATTNSGVVSLFLLGYKIER